MADKDKINLLIDWRKAKNPYKFKDSGLEDGSEEDNVEAAAGSPGGLDGVMLMSGGESRLESFSDNFEVLNNKYNLWTIHTNFYITEKVSRLIEYSPGIEGYRLESPYRATVAVAPLFDKDEVAINMKGNITSLFFRSDDNEQPDMLPKE